jgi:hypothetical protein
LPHRHQVKEKRILKVRQNQKGHASPMTMITELAQIMQHVLTEDANRLAKQAGFIQRQRKVTGAGFAQALVFSFLSNPASSRENVNQAAAAAGLRVSTPGLDQRFTARAVVFLDALLQAALSQVVGASRPINGLLARFNGVYLADTTLISLPPALATVWPGVNGIDDAAVKVAVRWDLRCGGLGLWLSGGRLHDQKTGVCAGGLPAGSLRLNDLGFFNLTTFAADVAQGVDFFSRYKHGTTLFDADGTRLDLPTLLPRRARQPLDLAIQLGQQRLPCRLLALPVPATVAAERRRRLRYQAKRKQRPVSRIALVLADWNLYVTSLSAAQLALAEAPILARTRWQIERLFKLWKSNGLLDEWRSRDPWRVWCELYGKLLALLFQHWLSVVSCWHFLDRSLHRAAQVIGNEAFHLLAHLGQRSALIAALHHLQTILAHTCHLSKRAAQPRTFQLWIEAQLA